MNIITEPSVTLVAKQVLDQDGLAKFLNEHNITWESDSDCPADVIPEIAGRLCYMSYSAPRPGGNAAYLDHIKDSRHGSVLEHTVFSFIITGVSRSLTHELVRHRAGLAFSQLSQRYVDESVAEYVCPPELLETVKAGQKYLAEKLHKPDAEPPTPEEFAGARWIQSIESSHFAYVKKVEYLTKKLETRDYQAYVEKITTIPHTTPFTQATWIEKVGSFKNTTADRTARRKEARQAARSVLPNATETKIMVTANARALRHFLEQRGSAGADTEIRRLANVMLDLLQREAPSLFGDYVKHPLPDGSFDLQTPYRKV